VLEWSHHDGTGLHTFRYRHRPVRHRMGRAGRHRRATPRSERGADPRAAHAAISRCARSAAAARGAGCDRRHRRAPAWRGARSLRCCARHGTRGGVRPSRLRDRSQHSRRRDVVVRGGCRAAGRPRIGARRGAGARAQPVPHHRAVPSRARGRRQGRGFSANGGVTTKLRLLTIERARTSATPTLFDGDSAFGLAVKPRRRRSA
jgi:hypothetical protein